MGGLHCVHLGERAPEAQNGRVPGEDARHHGVDEHRSGLGPDSPRREVEHGLVAGRPPSGEGLGHDPQAPRQGEQRTPEERDRVLGNARERAVPDEKALARAGVARHWGQPEVARQRERLGHVVEEPGGAVLDDEAVRARRRDVAAWARRGLENRDVLDAVRAAEPVTGRQTGHAAADDGRAERRVSHCLPPLLLKRDGG